MLPSEKPSQILFDTVGGELVYNPPVPQEKTVNVKPQHLYILSNEEIKEGGFWNYEEDNHIPVYYVPEDYEMPKEYPWRKIIATTDADLNKVNDENKVDESWFRPIIPKIPQNIIEAYVKKPFDEVEVEYERGICKTCGRSYSCHNYRHPFVSTTAPKLNQDGTLAVSLVEHSDLNTYLRSRERILSSQANDSESPIQHQLEARNKLAEVRQTLKWIKENL